MTSIVFFEKDGDPLPRTEDGLTAVLDSEFVDWSVAWAEESDRPMFVRFGPDVLQLEAHPSMPGRLRVPPKRKKGAKGTEESRSKGYVGTVVIYGDKECTQMLMPMLRVDSTNLTAVEFREILEDLRNQVYAISIYSSSLKVAGTDNSEQLDLMPLGRFLRELNNLESVINVYLRQLRAIRRNPSQVVRRVRRVVSVERAVRAGFVSQTFRVPENQQRISIISRESSDDTPERRFIQATAAYLLDSSRANISWLEARLSEADRVEKEDTLLREQFPKLEEVQEKARKIYEKRGIRRPKVRDSGDVRAAQSAISRIKKKVESLSREVGRPKSDIEGTRIRTNRLEMSIEYGPALRAWVDYKSESDGFDQAARLFDELDERTVAPSPILYERWMTARIYAELLRRGFQPSPGEPNLLDLMEVAGGEVVIQRNRLDLVLTGEFADYTVSVRMRHEPTMSRVDGTGIRLPDLVLDLNRVGNGTKIKPIQISQTWVLDAKYKNYKLPAPPSQLDDVVRFGDHFYADLLGVAEWKYRRGLGVDGSVIVHPDLDPEFLYLDPLSSVEWRKNNIGAASPHSVLAIPLRPGSSSDSQVTRLFRIMFGFHLKLTTICWFCGSEGERSAVPGLSQGDCFKCVGCRSFWIVHWCFKCGKAPILKYAIDPIHETEPGQPFNVHCPHCEAHFRDATSTDP